MPGEYTSVDEALENHRDNILKPEWYAYIK